MTILDPTDRTVVVPSRCSREGSPAEYGLKFERDEQGGWGLVARLVPTGGRRALVLAAPGAGPGKQTAWPDPASDIRISGRIYLTNRYKGCPYCEREGRAPARKVAFCYTCKHVGCLTDPGESYVCPWCGASAVIQTAPVGEMDGIRYQAPRPRATTFAQEPGGVRLPEEPAPGPEGTGAENTSLIIPPPERPRQ